MSTVRMWILAKMERARLKEVVPARSKSWEERPDAPEGGAKGSHDRREKVAVAWRSGHGRKVGAVETAKAELGGHSAFALPSCNSNSLSAVRPTTPNWGACWIKAGQYSTGTELRRFISETAETFIPIIPANLVLPPKASMRSRIVFISTRSTHNQPGGQHDLC